MNKTQKSKQEFEFRKTYRNWFKCLSDAFPTTFKTNIVKYYKAHMDKSHSELLCEFYEQAKPFLKLLANSEDSDEFFNTCAAFYPDIEYHSIMTTTEKGCEKDFRREQLVFLNKLCYISTMLLDDDSSELSKFVSNINTLDGTDMENMMKQMFENPPIAPATAANGGGLPPNVLNNPLLSSLAEEISKEVQIPDSFKNIESPQDIFKLMMNKDGKDFMEEMVKTVSGKIQDKIKNGELNEQDLFAQAQSMMGSVFQNNPMFSNLSSMFGGFGGGGGGGAESASALVAADEQQRKTDLRKALREKLKHKRNERN